ncbi:hypothetical protein LRR80_00274 [Streptomyces sp. RO-S4]|uniref:DUF1963 domain-containing protein n=2 Tax=Streptomyces TaxID=1883 RepID=UPI0020966377|nr:MULTISPECIES: DUF1963 domain-containing protein [unclassified Streptomyces]MCO4694239.1 hypothetical protein [Streptomyces sp. RO-S4]MDU0301210.1 DUF1963 domain-containing protein [Streptomyces sp. PAL114]
MPIETPDILHDFRESALAEGIPPDDIARWTALARPCAMLGTRGDGPVVGRLGGPLMLPADAPDPWCKLAATVDLAALPAGVTDLDLPADGHLLLFADPDPDRIGQGNLGTALHIPAGTPVEERPADLDPEWKSYPYEKDFPEGLLRLRTDVSLPYYTSVHAPGQPLGCVDHPDHPHADELIDVWTEMPGESTGRGLQLGGYAEDEYWAEDPSVAAGREAARAVARGDLPAPDTDVRPEDWVCLAQWVHGLDGLEMALYSWSISRQDLAAGRFDRVYATMTWNP